MCQFMFVCLFKSVNWLKLLTSIGPNAKSISIPYWGFPEYGSAALCSVNTYSSQLIIRVA